jgi:hypothetical protein
MLTLPHRRSLRWWPECRFGAGSGSRTVGSLCEPLYGSAHVFRAQMGVPLDHRRGLPAAGPSSSCAARPRMAWPQRAHVRRGGGAHGLRDGSAGHIAEPIVSRTASAGNDEPARPASATSPRRTARAGQRRLRSAGRPRPRSCPPGRTTCPRITGCPAASGQGKLLLGRTLLRKAACSGRQHQHRQRREWTRKLSRAIMS